MRTTLIKSQMPNYKNYKPLTFGITLNTENANSILPEHDELKKVFEFATQSYGGQVNLFNINGRVRGSFITEEGRQIMGGLPFDSIYSIEPSGLNADLVLDKGIPFSNACKKIYAHMADLLQSSQIPDYKNIFKNLLRY